MDPVGAPGHPRTGGISCVRIILAIVTQDTVVARGRSVNGGSDPVTVRRRRGDSAVLRSLQVTSYDLDVPTTPAQAPRVPAGTPPVNRVPSGHSGEGGQARDGPPDDQCLHGVGALEGV